jgi:hypothetical protein
MNVTNGLRPDNIDKEVRFRTTYYFRAFDYCWKDDAALGRSTYRAIIPASDVVYRFRMTGKASGLANNIRFESGTLRKDDIEPFGKTIRYNAAAGAFQATTPEQVIAEIAQERADRAAAAAAAERAGQRALAEKLLPTVEALVAKLPDGQEALTKAVADLSKAIDASVPPATPAAVQQAIDVVKEQATTIASAEVKKAVQGAVATLEANLKTVSDRLALLEGSKAAAVLPGCGGTDFIQRGFEIMGPEGIRKLDPNERVVMAMYSSADPLIETLQEYSNHMLAGQTSPADRLLPLAQAAVRLGDARRAVDAVAGGAAGDADGVFAAALQALAVAKAGP